jgi:hypothetical protein
MFAKGVLIPHCQIDHFGLLFEIKVKALVPVHMIRGPFCSSGSAVVASDADLDIARCGKVIGWEILSPQHLNFEAV